MLDPRFPPQPNDLKIPLYPPQIPSKDPLITGTLTEILSACIPKDALGRTVFFASATASCITYLQYYRNCHHTAGTLGLPAFICPHFCMQLHANGIPLLFLDIGATLFYTKATVQQAANLGVEILLWPVLLGARVLPAETMHQAKILGMHNLVDAAQAFPGVSLTTEWDTLVSFGRSKRLGACAGGGIVFASSDTATDFRRYRSNHLHYGKSQCNVKAPRKHFATLPELLDTLDHKPTNGNEEITSLSVRRSLSHSIALLATEHDRMRILYARLYDCIAAMYGERALALMQHITTPSPTVFALRLPAALRYATGAWWSAHGVQSTWYYYPAHRIRTLRHLPATTMHFTDCLAAEILILPFSSRVCHLYFDRFLDILSHIFYHMSDALHSY